MKIFNPVLFRVVFFLSAFLLNPSLVFSDDTEIFFNNPNSTPLQPNLLFVLDTSGSMTNKDGGSSTRLERMKEAMRLLLKDGSEPLDNVNVGVMRFMRSGGTVVYPIRDINETVGSTVLGNTTAIMRSGNDDAVEAAGLVTLNNNELSLTSRQYEAASQISASRDDHEEKSANPQKPQSITSSDLELSFDGSEQRVGLRFQNLVIPTGSKINSAYLVFTVDALPGASDQSLSVNVAIETSDTGRFSENNGDIDDRVLGSVLKWDITTPSPAKGEIDISRDFSAIVQQRIDAGSWNSAGDTMTFVIEKDSGSGIREYESYDGSSSDAARLFINYTPSTGAGSQTIGLRFQSVEIPQGANITKAVIEFTAIDGDGSATRMADTDGSASFVIQGQDSGDAAEFSSTANNITGRAMVSSSVNWTNVVSVITPAEIFESAQIQSVLQQITDRSDWCGGNSIVLKITGGANLGSRLVQAYDQDSSFAAKLKIEYDPASIDSAKPAPHGCTIQTYTAMVNSSAHDAEEASNGDMYLDSSDLEMTEDGSNTQKIGLIFDNLYVPKGSSITDAYISFTAKDNTSDTTNLTIAGENSASAGLFISSKDDISDRTLLSTTIPWSSVPSWTSNNTYQTPSISSLIQLMINHTSWVAGNDLGIVITGTGKRRAYSYDGNAGLAAQLTVKARTYGLPTQKTKTVRDELYAIVNEIKNSSGTPIVDAYYEAALYYKGLEIDSGKTRGSNSDSKKVYDRVSHAGSYTGGSYVPNGCTQDNLDSTTCLNENITGTPIYTSAITDECQKTSHLILLTDGQATQNTTKSKVETLVGKSCASRSNSDETCGNELSTYLYDEDQSALGGTQRIKTYTIGFNFSGDWLKSLATDSANHDANKDGYYTANSAEELVAAFEDIAADTLNVDTTFVTPGVTVNNFNQLNHLGQLYYALFKPDSHPRWPGNLKRYELSSTGDILDVNGNKAIDATSGFFTANSKSYWSAIADGNDVQKGGAAFEIPQWTSRKMFTSNAAGNALETFDNSHVSKTDLGIGSASDADYNKLINWVRGSDILDVDGDNDTTENRNQLSDPLHSTPILATYAEGPTPTVLNPTPNPEIVVFYGDNEGFLHGINNQTGAELFSFIPRDLIAGLNTLYINQESNEHPYGLDGEANLWVNDVDGKGISSGDHVYVYIGMRRGGRNYYAINATNRTSPSLLWQIKGGVSGDFQELGQSWSKPVSTRIIKGNSTLDVLIFSGGYDAAQDNKEIKSADSQGRAIYIVNATTGALIWSGGGSSSVGSFDKTFADMNYSIPSNIRAIDVNGDGVTDQFYVGDMGGQLWRFDINNGTNQASKLVSGAVIADISGTTAADNRRFYYAPDISVITKGPSRYLSIAIATGYRAHPLDLDITDRIYMFKDIYVASPPDDLNGDGNPDYVKITESDLFDTTDNTIGEGSATERAAAQINLDKAKGWLITLPNKGEKSLSASMTFGNELFFTTYEPTASAVGCVINAGTPRLYRINKEDGRPVVNYNEVGGDDEADLTADDRAVMLLTPAIPPTPQRLRIDGKDVICVGTECELAGNVETINKTYWLEE